MLLGHSERGTESDFDAGQDEVVTRGIVSPDGSTPLAQEPCRLDPGLNAEKERSARWNTAAR